MVFVWKRCHSALSLCVCLSKKARNYGHPHFRKGRSKVGMTSAHQEPDSVLQLFWWIYFSVCLCGIYVFMFVCMNMCEGERAYMCMWRLIVHNFIALHLIVYFFIFIFLRKGIRWPRSLLSLSLWHLAFNIGANDLNSGLHALLTEPSPGPRAYPA